MREGRERERERKTRRETVGNRGSNRTILQGILEERWRRASPPSTAPSHVGTWPAGHLLERASCEPGGGACLWSSPHWSRPVCALYRLRAAGTNFLLTEDGNQIHVLPLWSTSGAWMGSHGRPRPSWPVSEIDQNDRELGGNRWFHLLTSPRGGQGSGPFWVSLADRDRDVSAEGKVLKFQWVTGSCSICKRRQPWRGDSSSVRRKASRASQNS